MNFPKRDDKHVAETTSWKAVKNVLPDQWLLRDIAERDYGVDAYLEIVQADGAVTGELVSLQLKSTAKTIDWKPSGTRHAIYDHTGVSVSTCNYWRNIGVPVFLLLVELPSQRVWFANAKNEMRRRWHEVTSQKTFTFEVDRNDELVDGKVGRFVEEYLREASHPQFAADLATLLTSASAYRDFCNEHVGRDAFMQVDPLDLLTFSQMHRVVTSVSRHLGIRAQFASYDEVVESDRKKYGDDWAVHESSLDHSIRQLRPLIGQLILAGTDHVANDLMVYWLDTFPALSSACQSDGFKHIAKDFLR